MIAGETVLVRRRRLGLSRARGNLLLAVSASLIVALAAIALLAPLIAPRSPQEIDLSHTLSGSTSAHLLGTDNSGRDILSRLIWGARTSLIGPLAVVVLSTLLGVLIGMTSAWNGGWLDASISRVIDLMFSFPGLILAILAVSMFGPGLEAPVIALTVAYAPWIARAARAATLQERERAYVAALRVQGMSAWRICARHLLPNIAPLILAQAAINFGYALIDLAGLSYLGLGVQPPDADWGLMISEGQSTLTSGHPEQALFAGAMVVLSVVAFNVVADALADRIGGGSR